MSETTTVELVPKDPFEIPANPRDIPRKVKGHIAFELRKAGAPYELIAERLGYSNPNSAERAVGRVLRNLHPPEDVKDVLNMELERLDALQLVAWRQAKEGNLAAIDRVLKIMERRSHYLGLDSKQSVTDTVVQNNTAIFIGGTEDEYVSALEQARSQATAAITA